MENKKINIAEILKDCPSGMELNCTIYENVEFDLIDTTPEVIYPIHCLIKTNVGYESLLLTSDGCINRHSNGKCVIFPENKTTWEGFVPPCKFKDGDIVYFKTMQNNVYIAIFKINQVDYLETYIKFYINDFGVISSSFDLDSPVYLDDIKEQRLATKKEKQKLFQAIKANGYKWNAAAKTLEKLIEPKFKMGDVVQDKDGYKIEIIEIDIDKEYYWYISKIAKGVRGISFKDQDEWELFNNKFDINTLVPFETKVLVRDSKDQAWTPAIWGFYDKHWTINKALYRVLGGLRFNMCIPYENNEHLLGTTNDCKEYYKIWKE